MHWSKGETFQAEAVQDNFHTAPVHPDGDEATNILALSTIAQHYFCKALITVLAIPPGNYRGKL